MPEILDLKYIKKKLPKRKKESHKGDYGKVFVLAGSEGMLGAGILCSRGAMRAGAGLVYLGVPHALRDIANIATPEVITLSINKAKDAVEFADKADVLAIGPGLGKRRTLALDLLLTLSEKKYKKPIVLDADGLNAFVGDLDLLKKLKLNLILTPHPGEMARLTEDKQKNRLNITKKWAKKLKQIVVLKGANTVIATPKGKVFMNPTGNPGMASAGVGDVLTGMITGFLGQGLSPIDAACVAVFLHGLAGDTAVKIKSEFGLIASDIIEALPYLMSSL